MAALNLAAACLTFTTGARAEAAGPPVPAALAIPSVASSAAAFVPEGFRFVSEVTGDLGDTYPGVAQIYEDAGGRRALLIGQRRPDGFEASGWGFVLPCRTCGGDLGPGQNVELQVRQGAVIIVDRSATAAQGVSTRAELVFRRDAQSRKWRLMRLTQLTVLSRAAKAEQSVTDYERGETLDALGRMDGAAFVADTVETARIDAPVLTLDSLVLY